MYSENKQQLFLLHFAGGNSYSYNFIRKYLEKSFEFHSLELPGRGKRISEDLLYSKKDAIEDYFRQIKKLRNNQPYLIFGHSMGATLGLSVTKMMEGINDAPEKLIVSGNSGPGISTRDYKRYLLDDNAFKEELRGLGGVPNEVLENEELFSFFNTSIRADFEILEKDMYSEKDIVLKTPIYAIMGDEEEMATEINNWSKFTANNFNSNIWSGNHFFIHKYPYKLSRLITKSCGQLLMH